MHHMGFHLVSPFLVRVTQEYQNGFISNEVMESDDRDTYLGLLRQLMQQTEM